MKYKNHYSSPLGEIILEADDEGLTGLWFLTESRYGLKAIPSSAEERDTEVFDKARNWLDIYFSGHAPDCTPPLHMTGSPFRIEVCRIMLEIPYGETITYGEIAKRLAEERGVERISAQAVGGAVGHNPISIIIPCHRVVGSKGNLTGYGGGIQRKISLLELEGADMDEFFVPEKGTALHFI